MANLSYSKGSVFLHWLLAALIILMLLGGFFVLENLPKDNPKLAVFVYNWHKTIGILVLILTIIRILWRIFHKPPALPDFMLAWEKLLSNLVHFGFYVFMLAMPLSGWALVSTGKYPSFIMNMKSLKLPNLPFWQGLDKEAKHEVHEFFEETHEVLAYIAVALIILHIIGAIKHMRTDKKYAVRMMPWKAKKLEAKKLEQDVDEA